MLAKAAEEIQEVFSAPTSKKLLELADVQICLWGALHKYGYSLSDLLTAVEYKTIVNSKREWNRTPEGTFQHKEGK
jgi:hypothetical protein